MEKYATYKIYKNKETGDIKRVPLAQVKETEKIASLDKNDKWEELEEDETYTS